MFSTAPPRGNVAGEQAERLKDYPLRDALARRKTR
jgi:hypothetical protein